MKIEYQFINLELNKDITYETSWQSFDTELKNELNRLGQDGWELIFLRDPHVSYNNTVHICRCSYKGLFKRIITEETVIITQSL